MNEEIKNIADDENNIDNSISEDISQDVTTTESEIIEPEVDTVATVVEDVSYEVDTVSKAKKPQIVKGYNQNPFYAKIKDAPNTKYANFSSISIKTLIFIALNIIGAISPFLAYDVLTGLPAFLIAVAVTVGVAFVGYFVPVTVPVLGIIYSLGQGYIFSIICLFISGMAKSLLTISLVITISVLLSMLLLYSAKLTKYPQKVKPVILSIISTLIIGSVIIFVSAFFSSPMIDLVVGSGVLGIIILIATILLSVLSLNLDFLAVSKYIQEGLHKKYEWICAFSFILTIPIFFIRIVETVLKAVRRIKEGL